MFVRSLINRLIVNWNSRSGMPNRTYSVVETKHKPFTWLGFEQKVADQDIRHSFTALSAARTLLNLAEKQDYKAMMSDSMEKEITISPPEDYPEVHPNELVASLTNLTKKHRYLRFKLISEEGVTFTRLDMVD